MVVKKALRACRAVKSTSFLSSLDRSIAAPPAIRPLVTHPDEVAARRGWCGKTMLRSTHISVMTDDATGLDSVRLF